MSSPPSASASPPTKPASLSPDEARSEHEEGGQSPEPSTSKADSEKAEEKTSKSPAPSTSAAPTASAGDWQAIWSPAHNAYYFFNSITQETTWVNPLEQAAPTRAEQAGPTESDGQAAAGPSTSTSATVSQLYAAQEAAAAQGIDPSLAYLDPSLAAGSSTNPAAYSYTAKFNARTGAFARPDARDPTHLSEYERMKRMNEVFFDQAQWEAQLEDETEAGSKKRKKPTKKDLVSLVLF
jgi:hypothetical protein